MLEQICCAAALFAALHIAADPAAVSEPSRYPSYGERFTGLLADVPAPALEYTAQAVGPRQSGEDSSAIIDSHEFKVLCQNTVAGGNFDLVAGANMPQFNCHSGLSNTEFGTLDFSGAATGTQGAAIFHLQMPDSWATVTFDGYWLSVVGNSLLSVTWYLQLACVAGGLSPDPAWDTARSYTIANQANGGYLNAIPEVALTLPGSCVPGTPGPILFGRLYRNGSDTLGAANTASLVSIRLTLASVARP